MSQKEHTIKACVRWRRQSKKIGANGGHLKRIYLIAMMKTHTQTHCKKERGSINDLVCLS